MANPNAPFHPIVFVRGHAMSRAEIDATTADPSCVFNLGSVEDLADGRVEVEVPFDGKTSPGLRGALRFVLSAWNEGVAVA